MFHQRQTLAAIAVALAALLPVAATALEGVQPMSPDSFAAYSTGQTLTFAIDGVPYGIEQYLPGQRVIWAFIGEECREGRWFAMGPQICFEYDNEPGRMHCWTFYDTGEGLVARSEGIGAADLVEVGRSPKPMHCPAPDVGA
jgi:hypothetical protein